MRTDKKKIYGKSLTEWSNLADRYFEAETTEHEERLLKRFLATSEAEDATFDEVKAVMGFFALGKQYAKETPTISIARRKNRSFLLKHSRIAAAAILACIACGAGWHYIYQQQNICVAYINGVKYTDTKVVMTQMFYSIAQIEPDKVQQEMEVQMKEIFNMSHEDSEIN